MPAQIKARPKPNLSSAPQLEDLRNQSGSAALLARALGMRPQSRPQGMSQLPPPAQPLQNQRPASPPMVNQTPTAPPNRRATQQGSQQSGSFYADTPQGPQNGTYYAGSGAWYGNRPPPRISPTIQPNQDLQPRSPGMLQPTAPGSQFGGPTPAAGYNRTVPQFGAPAVQAAGPKQGGPVGGGGSGGGGGTPYNPQRQSQNSTYTPPSGSGLGSSGSGLAPAGQEGLDDTPGNPVDLNALGLTNAGFTVESDGSIMKNGQLFGNINDPGSWSQDIKDAIAWGNDPSNFLQADDGSGVVGAGKDNRHNPYGDDPGQVGGSPESALDRWLRENKPPQFDESELNRVNDTTRANYARQKARAVRAAAEAGAYGGAGADQMAAAIGDTGIQYALAGEAEAAQNQLQLKVQNFQSQIDYYNKAFAAAMQDFQATQNQKSFENAMKMAAYSADLQKGLIKYQQQLQDQISPGDILGGLLGLGSNIGGTYLGFKLAGGA